MNVIPFKRLDIYEFFCDTTLIDEVLTEIKNSNIVWDGGVNGKPISKDYSTKLPEKGKAGYIDYNQKISYYNNKLFNWYQECLDKVSELHYRGVKLSIIDAWLTKSTFGELTQPHFHSNSVVSGLLYFSDFNQSSTIFSYKKDPWLEHLPNMILHPENTIKITPQKGKLVIWRSDIMHSVQPHTDLKNTRYTMAFNTFFDGQVSASHTGMMSLKVDSVKDRYDTYMNTKNNETM